MYCVGNLWNTCVFIMKKLEKLTLMNESFKTPPIALDWSPHCLCFFLTLLFLWQKVDLFSKFLFIYIQTRLQRRRKITNKIKGNKPKSFSMIMLESTCLNVLIIRRVSKSIFYLEKATWIDNFYNITSYWTYLVRLK